MIDTFIQFWIGLLELMAVIGVLTAVLMAIYMLADLRDAAKAQGERARRHDDSV